MPVLLEETTRSNSQMHCQAPLFFKLGSVAGFAGLPARVRQESSLSSYHLLLLGSMEMFELKQLIDDN